MKYLENWSSWNPKNLLIAKEYVDSNLNQLLRLFPLSNTMTDSEKYEELVKFFSEDIDRIHSYSIYTVGRPNQLAVPTLMNIGGVVKYR